ncbi:MAG: alpha/beta hydrolase [Myxococcota bacterium]
MIHTVTASDVVAVGVTGRGPTVLAVHGAAGASDVWDELVARCPDLRFVRPDLRGFGRTPRGAAPSTFDELVDDLAAVCEALCDGPTWVVGFSFGGWLAVRLAERRPDLVAGLVLVGAPLRADPALHGPFTEVLRRIAADGFVAEDLVTPFLGLWFSEAYRAAEPRVVAAARDQLTHGDPEAVARMVRWHLDGPDLRATAARLAVPVVPIVGDDERIVDVEALRAAFGGVRVVPDCGHLVPLEQPDALARWVREAVTRG